MTWTSELDRQIGEGAARNWEHIQELVNEGRVRVSGEVQPDGATITVYTFVGPSAPSEAAPRCGATEREPPAGWAPWRDQPDDAGISRLTWFDCSAGLVCACGAEIILTDEEKVCDCGRAYRLAARLETREKEG